MTYGDACREIASTLAQFERQSNRIVRSVEIEDIDTSAYNKRLLMRRVIIHADPVPGTMWDSVEASE